MNPRRTPRGFTLIEVMIALVVLLVGLLGMMRLQVIGMQANQGSRAQSVAVELARELGLALERLSFDDPLLNANGTGATPPAPFGRLLDGTTLASGGYTPWTDDKQAQLPSVRADAVLDHNSDGTPVYARRWTVWAYQRQPGPLGGKVIAVSVVFRERASPILYEVVYLTYVSDASSISASALVGSQSG